RRTSQITAGLIQLEGTLGVFKKVASVKSIVVDVFEEIALQLVRLGRRYNSDLGTGPFAILGAIGMLQDVVFPNSFDSKQLPTGSGGRDVSTAGVRTKIVHTVHEKPVGLRPLARNREGGPG